MNGGTSGGTSGVTSEGMNRRGDRGATGLSAHEVLPLSPPELDSLWQPLLYNLLLFAWCFRAI